MKKSFKKPNYKTAVSKNVEKQRSEGRSYGYLNLPNGVELFKETKGRITVDIIPYVISNPHHADIDKDSGIEVGTLWYKMPFKVHRGIGPGDGETVVCPTTFGKPCPICEYRKKRQAEGADKDEIKALNPSKRNLYAVIPLGVKDFEEKIHIWNTTDFFVQELINKELEENEDMACFPDLEDGFSLKFRFDEESFSGNKYYKPSRLDFDERDAYDESILDEVPDLDKCIKVQSYKELEALLFQVEPEDVDDTVIADDDDEDEKPIRRKKTVEKEEEDEKPIRRNKKPEPEPEPEPEEEDDDEGDTPPPPKKKNNAKAQEFIDAAKKRGVPMDDDDDDDDDEDEEDEKPRAKAGKKEEKPAAKSGKGACPFGHTFGEDNDAYPKDCKKCDVWDDCFDAQ